MAGGCRSGASRDRARASASRSRPRSWWARRRACDSRPEEAARKLPAAAELRAPAPGCYAEARMRRLLLLPVLLVSFACGGSDEGGDPAHAVLEVFLHRAGTTLPVTGARVL